MTIQKKDYDMISRRLQALQRVSVQLMSQQSSKALLHKTVRYAMDLLHCDAGSLFLKAPGDMLSFEVAINDSIHYDFQKIKIPMDRPGLATFVFSRGQSLFIKDVYEIPEHLEGVDFDPVLDTSIGYRTRSAIIVPLISTKGKVLGVIQLLNKKEDSEQQWPINNEEMIASMPSFDR
ncbi:GAF domain-containing protein, partial [bacterium]|nr:GAF domain-containing protein [bacterium]